MTCRELLDFIMAYLDGELSNDQSQVFESHIALCRNCDAYVQTYRKTQELIAALCDDDDEVPDEVPEELVQGILDARRKA